MIRLFKNIIKSWPLPRFACCGGDVIIARPRFINNPGNIRVGREVYIGKDSVISVLRQRDGAHGRIDIGDRVWATSRLSVFSLCEVAIEDDVLIAANVFISDGSRGHVTAEVPYKQQPYDTIKPIRIGKGSWLGQNVVIMPGVTVGHNSIVGANSVLTRSIPPGSVAVGAPARVVKRWDWEAKTWRKEP